MDSVWIIASIAAAFFQALRYAALKELNKTLSTTVATYARMLFGLPLLALHLLAVTYATGSRALPLSASFLLYCACAAFGQFLGTVLIMRTFQLGNFAVATMLVKADVVMTAILGMVLFDQPISTGGWAAIAVTLAGVLLTSAGGIPLGAYRGGRISLSGALLGRVARLSLLCALIYSLSYLFLREAIVVLGPEVGGPAMRAAWAGVVMTVISVVIMGAWLLVREPRAFPQMLAVPWQCTFVGVVSALGTILWFLAAALTNVAYVAAVAQVQIVFALAISHFYFRESIRRLELVGIGVILCGVLLFRLV